VIVFLFWLLFWSTPDPLPTKSSKDPKGKDQKEGLYDLKIGSWQNRVDQDLEATKKQLAELDIRQQEIRDQFKNVGDALSDLTLQMKAEKESRWVETGVWPGFLDNLLKRRTENVRGQNL